VRSLKIIVFYNGEFGQRLVGNLVNCSGFCISCGEACSQCRSGKFTSADDIVALYEMPDPATLGDFIDDVEPLLPQGLPEADIAIVVNVHREYSLASCQSSKRLGLRESLEGPRGLRSCRLARESSWRSWPRLLEWRLRLPSRFVHFALRKASRL
jgi:hypothetical protein